MHLPAGMLPLIWKPCRWPLFLNWKWTKDVRPISGNAYLSIWESAAISLETGNDLQRKLAALLFAQALRYGKKDPYLMARCGFRLANLYIRMKEPQKARLAASFIPPIRGMEGSRALIRKWTAPPSCKKKRRQ